MDRERLLRQAQRLALLTVGWNLVEGVVGVGAALRSGSVALLGFGLDSFVESASGVVILWLARAERRGRGGERVQRRAERLVGASLAVLAAWVAYDAVSSLALREPPEPSTVGLVLAVVSILTMGWLAWAKRRVARGLSSRAMEADAFQTLACLYLSFAVLVGVGLNAWRGWWWADPLAALVIAALVAREAWEAWAGEGREDE